MRKYREWIIVLIVAIILIVANQFHVLKEWMLNPSGFYFTGIAHYFEDYFLYVNEIAWGAKGVFFHPNGFTNELIAPTLFYWPYTLMGAIGIRLFLSPFATYNVFLFLFTAGLICVWYMLAKRLYERPLPRLLFFFIGLTASNYPNIAGFFEGKLSFLADFWFSPTPALNRLGGVPHHLIQTMALLFLPTIWTAKKRPIMFVCLLTVVATVLSPVQTGLLVGTIGILEAFRFFGSRHIPKQDSAALFILFCSYAISAFATNQVMSNPLFMAARIWENNHQLQLSLPQFFMALGPIAIAITLGLWPVAAAWKRQSFLRQILILFSGISVVLFFSPVPSYMHILNARFLSPFMYSGLALVATEGMLFLFKKIKFPIVTYVFFFCFVFLSILSLIIQVDMRTNPQRNPIIASELNHVPPQVLDLLNIIKEQPNAGGPVVLVDPFLPYDVLVGAFTGKTSFTGHILHTLYLGTKNELRQQLVNGTMTKEEEQQFFQNHRIRYLFISQYHTDQFLSDDTLEFLYGNSAGSVFRVR